MMVNSGPEVDLSQWKSGFHEPLVSGSHSCSCVSYDGLWKNFIYSTLKVYSI